MKFNLNPVKGMRDFTPNEWELREQVRSVILETYKKFGYRPIETPVMEDITLMNSGQGGENEKMLFKILKRGEKLRKNLDNGISNENDIVDFGLRFDLTLPMARFYAGANDRVPFPFKVIQTGYVWRAERNQKGRFRQLMQCDIDVVGSKSAIVEAELIHVTSQALLNLGLNDFVIRINDRRILEKLAAHCGFKEEEFANVFIILDKIDKIGVQGVCDELLKNGYDKKPVDTIVGILHASEAHGFELEKISELIQVDKTITSELKFVIDFISKIATQFKIEYDMSLVRGMGYYTGQIFEIEFTTNKLSVGGGGRYDKMMDNFLKNKSIPACGFSIGFERIVQIVEEHKTFSKSTDKKLIIFIAEKDLNTYADACYFSKKHHASYATISVEFRQKNLKNQIELLAKQGYTHFLLQDEHHNFLEKNIKSIIK